MHLAIAASWHHALRQNCADKARTYILVLHKSHEALLGLAGRLALRALALCSLLPSASAHEHLTKHQVMQPLGCIGKLCVLDATMEQSHLRQLA